MPKTLLRVVPLIAALLLTLSACDGKSFYEDASDYNASDPQYKVDKQGRSTVAEDVITKKYEPLLDPAWGKPKKEVSYEDLVDDFGVDYGLDRTQVSYNFTDITPEAYAKLGELECTTESAGEKKNLVKECFLLEGKLIEESRTISPFSYQSIFNDGSTYTQFFYEYDPRYEKD